MNIFKIFILFFTLNASAYAQVYQENICEWLGNTATVIAQNRDNGIGEYDLIQKYLDQDKSYMEQNVVIHLISRIYSIEEPLIPEDIAVAEQKKCEIAMIIGFNRSIK